jgi:hypothetical protein
MHAHIAEGARLTAAAPTSRRVLNSKNTLHTMVGTVVQNHGVMYRPSMVPLTNLPQGWHAAVCPALQHCLACLQWHLVEGLHQRPARC